MVAFAKLLKTPFPTTINIAYKQTNNKQVFPSFPRNQAAKNKNCKRYNYLKFESIYLIA